MRAETITQRVEQFLKKHELRLFVFLFIYDIFFRFTNGDPDVMADSQNIDSDPGSTYSSQLLKLVAKELAPALTIIFQQSYVLSSTPKDWNSAIDTPFFKKDLISDPSSHRPI